jgi:hypothetical protein
MSMEGTLNEMLDALKQADAFKLKIAKASSPAELNAAQAGLARVSGELNGKFSTFNNDLVLTFGNSYRQAGGTGPIPKPYIDKAYRSRQKAKQGFERATVGLRQWGDQYAQDQNILNARKAYRAQIAKMERSGAKQAEIDAAKAKLNALPKGVGIATEEPSVFYRRKQADGTIKRTPVPAEQYMKMASNAAYNTQKNIGVAAAAATRSGWIIVHDGPDCGIQRHGTGSPNGEVWPAEQGMKYPIAHPYCQRYFTVAPGGPGSKKTKEMLRDMGLLRQRPQTMNTLAAIAQAAAATGMVASIAGNIITNPFINRFVRDVLEDKAIALSPLAQRVLNRLQTYAINEAKALADHGTTIGVTSEQALSKFVQNSFDEELSNAEFLDRANNERVTISQVQAKVLGLSTKPFKGDLLARIDDYGDYVVHKEYIIKELEERIQDAANVSHANEAITRTAALKFHLEAGPGANGNRNWYNTIQRLKKTYAENPDKAERDLVRLAAGVFDPTPWIRASLPHNVKFTIGLTSRGRQNLAVKIYDQLKGGRALTDAEVRWATELGMDLSKFRKAESITTADLVNAFTPRLTYQPGGMFNATLGLVNGKIQPIIRSYPPGTFGRFVKLEGKLRSGSVEDFITAMRQKDLPFKDRLTDAMAKVASEDLITSIHLFRNSPLQVSLRFIGPYVDSFALRVLPDNDFIRYNYRFLLDTRPRTELQAAIRDRLRSGEDIKSVMDDVIAEFERTRVKPLKEAERLLEQETAREVRQKLRKMVNRESALLINKSVSEWQQGIRVLPNMLGGFHLNGMSIDAREAIIKLKILGNSLIKISKETRYGYDQLLEIWGEFKTTVTDFLKTVQEKDIAKIRSFKDATELLGDALRDRTSIIDDLPTDLENVNLDFAGLAAHTDPALSSDLAKFRLAWESKYPGVPIPQVKLVTSLAEPIVTENGVIMIREDVARNWDLFGDLRRKSVRIGHFPRDTEATVANLMHEGAHALIQQMRPAEYKRVLRRIIESQFWSGKEEVDLNDIASIRKFLRKEASIHKAARSVSGYATTDADELISEALSEYFTAPHPRPVARAVGGAFEEMFGPTAKRANLRIIHDKQLFGWEDKTEEQLDDIGRELMDEWNYRTTNAGQDAGLDPDWEKHRPTWWFFDDPPPGLEDVEIDQIILNHPGLNQDLRIGLGKIHDLFPDLEFPRIGYHNHHPDYHPLEVLNGSSMFYDSNKRQIWITQMTVDNFELGAEVRAIGAHTGWSPAGTADSFNTVIHEMGHYVMRTLPVNEYRQVLEFIATSGMVDSEAAGWIQQMLRGNVRQELSTTVGGAVTPEEILNGVLVEDDNVWNLSQYATTNLQEFLAEAFLDGINNLLAGRHTLTTDLVEMLQAFGITGR